MRFPLHFSALSAAGALAAGLSGCVSQSSAVRESSLFTRCEGPRPQVCTMIYAPVCAAHADGSQDTLASACNACADDTVLSYRPGPCEDDSAS